MVYIYIYFLSGIFMMLKQSLWIAGFFFFGKLVYYEFIIYKYKKCTQMLKIENLEMHTVDMQDSTLWLYQIHIKLGLLVRSV